MRTRRLAVASAQAHGEGGREGGGSRAAEGGAVLRGEICVFSPDVQGREGPDSKRQSRMHLSTARSHCTLSSVLAAQVLLLLYR